MKLLETMRVAADGEIYLLSRHLERLKHSAAHFGFVCDPERLQSTIVEEVSRLRGESALLRLLLSRDGGCELEFKALPPAGLTKSLRISGMRVNSADPLLYHKTTERKIYEEARHGYPDETDVVLVNERGEATETSIANIAIQRENQWVTPVISCGLLAGTMRAQLLEEHQLIEGIIRVEDLVPGETIRCFNSVRGIFDVPLLG